MKKVDLTEGSVFKALTNLAVPIMLSSLLQFVYGLIDMLWVGRLGSDAITVIGSSSFFVGLGYSINAIVIIGTGIKVSHSIGEKNELATKEYINSGLALNLGISITYMIVLFIFGEFFIEFLGLKGLNIIRDSYRYLLISTPMLAFSFFNTLYIRILNSFGNNKDSLRISMIGIVVNIILDPILIYKLDFGVLGAAIATLIANLLMFILFNFRYWNELKFNTKLGINIKKVKEIITLGFPMALQRIIFTIVNILVAKLVAIYGDNAIAAQKIGLQIESVTFMVIGGLNGAVSSFIGQNFGAKKVKRVQKGYITALKIGGVYSIITTFIFIVFSMPLVRLFVANSETIIMGSNYLKILGVSQIFSMIEMVSNGVFTGVGRPNIPSIISIIFTIARIPIALILINFLGLNGIWLSLSISSILKGVISYTVYKVKTSKAIMLYNC
ncbi:MAG: MATE family efflux transporter [Clostridium sp.]|uniref:MATE family efflux transporter n=1 Tax=Clostridium sp. TaxID=1506 RepID=UPI003F33C882